MKAKRDVILDRWKRGDKASAIAADLVVPSQSVRNLITEARAAGDPRAVRRHAERSDKGKGRVAPDPLPCNRRGCVGLRHHQTCALTDCDKTYSGMLRDWQHAHTNARRRKA
jgi:hypothetical protein